jgi:hypothetical protein
MTGACGRFGTCHAVRFGSSWSWRCGASSVAGNPRYTKRFAFYVGRRCRQASIRDVAKKLRLDWEPAKTREMQYMQTQLERAGRPGPKAIGIDGISIRKGHSYRFVQRPRSANGRSGSAARIGPWPAWASSTPGWGRTRATASAWR